MHGLRSDVTNFLGSYVDPTDLIHTGFKPPGTGKKFSGADFHVGARFAPDDLCTASREERCTCGGATWIISIVTEPKPGATRNC